MFFIFFILFGYVCAIIALHNDLFMCMPYMLGFMYIEEIRDLFVME